MRLVWILLAVIVWNGQGFLNRTTATPLLLLPLIALAADLGFQAARFPRLRFPDAAIANGFFLTVILWPTEISLALVAVVVVTVGLRHAARVASHPIFNPAAAGVLIAAAVFAMPQPWHVGSCLQDTELVAVLGLLLWSKAWHTWRLWVAYLVANLAAAAAIADVLAGSSLVPFVLKADLLGAAPVFYALFMVTEPRTAPSSRPLMLVYGATVGLAAAILPALFAEYPMISALGVLAPYLALFAGNLLTIGLPSARGVHRPVPGRAASAPIPVGARARAGP